MDSPAKNPVTILVVEDHDDSRRMMKIMLELDGFRVITAATGHQALDLSASAAPDVVLMDVNLPDIDGLAVTRQIRERGTDSHTPIVALTAYDTTESRERALAAGCDEFMLKPVNFERLEALFCRLLATGFPGDPGSSASARPGLGTDIRRSGHPASGGSRSRRSRSETVAPSHH